MGDTITTSIVAAADYETCCTTCATLRPPSQPPWPPSVPEPPSTPPLPPVPPPTPWAPFPPAGPSNSQVTNNYPTIDKFAQPTDTTADLSLLENHECHGIVFKERNNGMVQCYFKTTEHLVVYTSEDVISNDITGEYVFAYSAPPPPPLEPSGAACTNYIATAYAELGTPGQVDSAFATAVVAKSLLTPQECCSRCTQSNLCKGFVIRRTDNACFLKRDQQPINIGHSNEFMAWSLRYPPPSTPPLNPLLAPPTPPTYPLPKSPPPPSGPNSTLNILFGGTVALLLVALLITICATSYKRKRTSKESAIDNYGTLLPAESTYVKIPPMHLPVPEQLWKK